jgi:hypothetical protein
LERPAMFGSMGKICYGHFSACRQTGSQNHAGGFGAART